MTKAFGTVSDDSKYRYRQGLGNAAAYQVSGHPYITGSTSLDNNRQVQILFPQVAITNTSGQAGGAFQVLAELTSVHPNDMYALTGSGLTDVDAVENFRQKTIS